VKWLREEQLLPEDGTVLPKHVGAIVKRKIKKYKIQCILLVILYIFGKFHIYTEIPFSNCHSLLSMVMIMTAQHKRK
jgi:hypothetical protein